MTEVAPECMEVAPECMICAYPFEVKTTPSSSGRIVDTEVIPRLRCNGSCPHCTDLCSICLLRVRAQQRIFACPVCKSDLPQVICGHDNIKSINIWGDSAGPDYTMDQRSNIFFPKEYYKRNIEPLFLWKCKVCFITKRDAKALKLHLNSEHNLQLCNLCIEHKQIFPSEQKVYSQGDYEKHLKNGDNDGSDGHPNCEFCKRRYYDKVGLFTHLSKDHFTCHLCEREGIRFKYYKDYYSLESHFRNTHYICEEPACIAKRFIVFASDIELASHTLQWHPANAPKRTISIQFKSRGPSRHGDGSVGGDTTNEHASNNSNRFDAGLAGRARDGEWQIELPISRDPREGNSNYEPVNMSDFMVVAPNIASQEEYPSLIPTASPRAIGWSSKTLKQNINKKVEDFPALGGGAPASSSNRPGLGTQTSKSMATAMPSSGSNSNLQNMGWPVKVDKRLKNKKAAVTLEGQQKFWSDSEPTAVDYHMGEVAGGQPVSNVTAAVVTDAATSKDNNKDISVEKKKSTQQRNNQPVVGSVFGIAGSLGISTKAKKPSVTVVKTLSDKNEVTFSGSSKMKSAPAAKSAYHTEDVVDELPAPPAIIVDLFSHLKFPTSTETRRDTNRNVGTSAPVQQVSVPVVSSTNVLPPPPGFSSDEAWTVVGNAESTEYPTLPPPASSSTVRPNSNGAKGIASNKPSSAPPAGNKLNKKVKNELKDLAFKR